MINTRIGLSLVSILATMALMVGATFAFFSDTANSEGNTLTAGTLEIDILDQNGNEAFEDETLASNWAPGDEATVNFDVLNTGSLPVNLRGFATGTWGNVDLDAENVVKVIKVERWNGGWEELSADNAGLTGYFYYSPTGGNVDLFELGPSERAQFRLTVLFDESAENDFQGLDFVTGLQVEAKQLNDNTSW